MLDHINDFVNKMESFLKSGIGSVAVYRVIIIIVFSIFLALALKKIGKWFFKYFFKALKVIVLFPKNVLLFRRNKKKRTVCHRCGRTLDKCVCQDNQKLSLSKRYRKNLTLARKIKQETKKK